jgi:hypothetical protein
MSDRSAHISVSISVHDQAALQQAYESVLSVARCQLAIGLPLKNLEEVKILGPVQETLPVKRAHIVSAIRQLIFDHCLKEREDRNIRITRQGLKLADMMEKPGIANQEARFHPEIHWRGEVLEAFARSDTENTLGTAGTELARLLDEALHASRRAHYKAEDSRLESAGHVL